MIAPAALIVFGCGGSGTEARPQSASQRQSHAPAGLSRFEGPYSFAFERSVFEGCYLNFSSKARQAFDARHPELSMAGAMGGMEFHIVFAGHREEGGRYGHLGHSTCQITVEQLISSRRTKPAQLPAPPPAWQ